MGKRKAKPEGDAPAGDNLVASWAADLLELEEQINDLQESKKRVYGNIREDHGRVLADAVKNAVRLWRMDDEKRERVDATDTETERVLSILSRSTGAPHVRAREIIEQFDPETGEITEPATSEPSGVAADQGEGAAPGSLATNSLADSPTAEKGDKPESDPLGKVAGQSNSDAVQPDPVIDGKLASSIGKAGEASAPASSARPRADNGLERPYGCQHVNLCPKTWRDTEPCSDCRKALALQISEAA